MWYIYIILLIVLIVSIWLLFYIKIKEGFDNLTVESCDILRNNYNGKYLNKANDILDNNRIKEFKPVLESKAGLENACYINNDPDNVKDVFMSDKTCSKEDPYWASIDFIKDVKPSEQVLGTKYDKFDRCVFEIDKSKISNKSLDKFWESWADEISICDRITKSIQEENDMLNKKHQKLVGEYNSNENIIMNLNGNIIGKNKQILDLRNEIKELQENLVKKNEEYKTILASVGRAELIYDKLVKDKTAHISKLNNALKELQKSFNEILPQYTKSKEEAEKLYKDIKELRDKIKPLTEELNQLYREVDTIIKKNEAILQELRIKEEEKTNALAKRKTLENNLSICNTTKEQLEKERNRVEKELEDCLIQTKEIESQLQRCESEKYQRDIEFDKLTKMFTKLKILLNQSKTIYNTLVNKTIDEETKFKETQKAFPYTSCKEFIEKNKIANNTITKCDKSVKETESKIEEIKKVIDETKGALDKCEAFKEESRTKTTIILPHYVPSCGDCSQACNDIYGFKGSFITYNKEYAACECSYTASDAYLDKSRANNQAIVDKFSKGMPKILVDSSFDCKKYDNGKIGCVYNNGFYKNNQYYTGYQFIYDGICGANDTLSFSVVNNNLVCKKACE
jgi:peptidoglycan hydrolase CwlO-like protein